MDRRAFLAVSVNLAVIAGLKQAAAAENEVRVRELYNKDLSFSDYAQSMEGKRVSVAGFMAPPLKAESMFFVLTNRPMSVCPFCETEAEWPNDILAVYTKRVVDVVPFNVKIVTRGTLDLGTFKDAETGFVSRVRIAGASYERD
jgi:hypothetical protein